MSRSRRDLHKQKLRRERIRAEKHADRFAAVPDSPPQPSARPFAMERALRAMHALTEGEAFTSVEELNQRLTQLNAGGKLTERAGAWKADDPKWRAQELAYDALETDSLQEALRLVNEALQLDPECTDAQRLTVSLLPAPPENKVDLMREVVETAERNLGANYFEANKGHFWGVITTRPYMRARLHLGELLMETGQYEEAAEVFERMLELNPGDSLGVRNNLVALCLRTRRVDQARAVIERYVEELNHSAMMAWSRVIERWVSGDVEGASAALEVARKVNAYAEVWAAGKREAPEQPPEYYQPGEITEAATYGALLLLASEAYPEFREWLRGEA